MRSSVGCSARPSSRRASAPRTSTGIVNKVLIPMVSRRSSASSIAFLLMLSLYWIFRNAKRKPMARIFRRLQVVSAGYMAFSHGSNDAQKTMGIITLALFAAGVIPIDRGPDLGDRRVGHGAVAGDRGRRLADHAHDGPPGRRAGARPWVRRRDDRSHGPHRHGPAGHARLDHACHLERDHGRRVRARPKGVRWGVARRILLAWVVTIPAGRRSWPPARGSSCTPSAFG